MDDKVIKSIAQKAKDDVKKIELEIEKLEKKISNVNKQALIDMNIIGKYAFKVYPGFGNKAGSLILVDKLVNSDTTLIISGRHIARYEDKKMVIKRKIEEHSLYTDFEDIIRGIDKTDLKNNYTEIKEFSSDDAAIDYFQSKFV